jgi:formylglycine-generating enzyme required for sulfatase activity
MIRLLDEPHRLRLFAMAALLTSLGSACDPSAEANLEQQVAHPTAVAQPGEAPPGMTWIPGGEFAMGGDDQYADAAERPVHRVRLDGFFMDVNTVTNAQFRSFVDATGYVTLAERAPDVAEIMRQLPPGTPPPDPRLLVPGSVVFVPNAKAVNLRDWSQWWAWIPGANWRHPDGPDSSIEGKDNFPVVQVAWDDAVAYARWAGRRLPTEAEWEFAARGGDRHTFHAWGNDPHDPEDPQAHIYTGSFPSHDAAPKPVGSFRPTAFGLYDMAGNVWQWTGDWYRPDTYAVDAARGIVSNPTGPPTGLDPRRDGVPSRVVRGGSFLCSDSYCRGYRVSARSPGAPDSGASHIGFRTVMTVDQWNRWKEAMQARS